MHNVNLIMRKHQIYPLENVLKSQPILFKKVKVLKDKTRLRNCSRLQNTKETSQLNVTRDIFFLKDISGITSEIQ